MTDISAARKGPPIAANDNEPSESWPLAHAASRGHFGEAGPYVMRGAHAYLAAIDEPGEASATAASWMPTYQGTPIVHRDPESLWAAERYADRAGRLRRWWRLLGELARPWHRVVVYREPLAKVAPGDATKRLAFKGGVLRIGAAGVIVARADAAMAWGERYGTRPPWEITRAEVDAIIERAANDWQDMRHPRQSRAA